MLLRYNLDSNKENKMSNPVVLVVWFCSDDSLSGPEFICWDDPIDGIQETSFLGMPLWMGRGRKPYFLWAIDMVTSTDQRMVALGPYENVMAAQVAFEKRFKGKERRLVRGYLVVGEHCMKTRFPKPAAAWTDG